MRAGDEWPTRGDSKADLLPQFGKRVPNNKSVSRIPYMPLLPTLRDNEHDNPHTDLNTATNQLLSYSYYKPMMKLLLHSTPHPSDVLHL